MYDIWPLIYRPIADEINLNNLELRVYSGVDQFT